MSVIMEILRFLNSAKVFHFSAQLRLIADSQIGGVSNKTFSKKKKLNVLRDGGSAE